MPKSGHGDGTQVLKVSKQYLKRFCQNVDWYEKLNPRCDANADAVVSRIALLILRIVELTTQRDSDFIRTWTYKDTCIRVHEVKFFIEVNCYSQS